MIRCLGDLQGDCYVQGIDLALLLGQWGPCSSHCCDADLNDDGVVVDSTSESSWAVGIHPLPATVLAHPSRRHLRRRQAVKALPLRQPRRSSMVAAHQAPKS